MLFIVLTFTLTGQSRGTLAEAEAFSLKSAGILRVFTAIYSLRKQMLIWPKDGREIEIKKHYQFY